MNELATVLDELVADAPIEKANWPDVLARSRKIRRPRRARRRLVVALAVITLLALAGTAVGVGISLLTQQERFHASLRDDPKRLGPLVEIASGDSWALIGWRDVDRRICLDFAIPGNSPFGCGFPVRGAKPATDASGSGLPTHAVAGFFSGGNLVGGDGQPFSASLRTRSLRSKSSFLTAESSMHPSMTPRPRSRPRFGSSSFAYALVS